MAYSGEHSKWALNTNALAFDMDAMNAEVAANTVSASDFFLPDFAMDKPEVWFTIVEALS
jgi:hypothetical protein